MIFVFGQDYRQQKNLRLTMNETIAYLPGLSPVAGKELCAWFDRGRLSSDGGDDGIDLARRDGLFQLFKGQFAGHGQAPSQSPLANPNSKSRWG